MSNFKIYLKNILIPLILGCIIGFITSGKMDYSLLTKPVLAPPGIVFPIVWSILYILMGISYALLITTGNNTKITKKSYYLQLIVNLIWPILFFLLKWRLFAFIWIILLLILVGNMIYQFYKQKRSAGLIQIPYFIWVAFATYLNLFFYLLNR